MSDVADIANSLVIFLSEAFIPSVTDSGSGNFSLLTVSDSGEGIPYAFDSLATTNIIFNGSPLSVYLTRGYPNPDNLDQIINAGNSMVTVNPVDGMTRDTTRFQYDWVRASVAPVTFTMAVNGSTVTFGGNAPVPTVTVGLVGAIPQASGQALGVGYGKTGWTYRPGPSDTPTTIAAAFAAAIPAAAASGSVLTVPTSLPLIVSSGGDATMIKEVRRQAQTFAITICTPDPFVRDTLGSNISNAMAQVRCLPGADGSWTNIPIYRGFWSNDKTQAVGYWSRTERYEIEYPTIVSQIVPAVLFVGMTVNNITAAGQFSPLGPLII